MKKSFSLILAILFLLCLGLLAGCQNSQTSNDPSEKPGDSSETDASSDQMNISVKSIGDIVIEDGKLVLDEGQWHTILSNDIAAITKIEIPADATYTANFDKATGEIVFVVTAKDGTVASKNIAVEVHTPFGKLNNSSENENLFNWDNTAEAFCKTPSDGNCTYYVDGNVLNGTYAFSCDLSFDGADADTQLILCAYTRENKMIRLIAKAVSDTKMVIASDYKDEDRFMNYTVHVPEFEYSGTSFNLGIAVVENNVAMTYNGKIIYRRALHGMDNSQLVIEAKGTPIKLSNLSSIVNDEETKQLYDTVTADYKDPLVGNTIGSTRNLSTCVQDLEQGTVRVSMVKTTNGSPMVAFYNNGVPLGGYSFAISGTMNAKTEKGYSGHITFMCYADNSNWSRFIINRREGNNSCYYKTKNNGVGDPANNTLYTSKTALRDTYDFTAPFTFIYDSGTVILYVDNVLMAKYETNWGYATAIMEILQNVDLTYYDMTATTDPLEVEKIRMQCEKAEKMTNIFENDKVFTSENGISFLKNNREYATSKLMENSEILCSDVFNFNAIMGIENPSVGGFAELLAVNTDGNGARFALEYLSGGSYRLIAQKMTEGSAADLMVLKAGTKKELNLGVALINGKLRFYCENAELCSYDVSGELELLIGGKDCNVKVKNAISDTDAITVEEFIDKLPKYTYVSSFEARAAKYEEQYRDAKKGQTLLIGSSSFDLWQSSRVDSNGNAIEGYSESLRGLPDTNGDGKPDVINVGIGGTTFRDWLSFYERLIQKFEPSQIVLYCGANDLNNGMDAASVYGQFAELMRLIRRDYPSIKVVYINVMPSGTLYGNRNVWIEAQHFEGMISQYSLQDDNFTVVDLFDSLCDNGAPIVSMWDSDKTHLNRDGYRVWAQAIRTALGLD